jgi:hypothetical protein
MKTPHKHAELIKQWADGAQIEYYCNRTEKWQYVEHPVWTDYTDYRVKPEVKPDIFLYRRIRELDEVMAARLQPADMGLVSDIANTYFDVEYTFDGNTGKLKSIKMI